MSLAIVGSAGGMKGIFVQGVLNAFESAGLQADAYAGASASALPVISAAAGLCNFVQYRYWQRVQQLLEDPANDLSNVMYQVTQEWNAPDEPFVRELFQSGRPRLVIPANYVKTEAVAEQTQTDKSRRLGRSLLLQIRKQDRTWVDTHLELHLYDTHADTHRLTVNNLSDVAYASTRMIHWRVPAEIDGKPYVDASYTCAFPVQEMVDLGYTEVIAISTESGEAYRDIFADTIIPDEINGTPIHIIQPDYPLQNIGVDFTACTADGLITAFQHGEAQGRNFLQSWQKTP